MAFTNPSITFGASGLQGESSTNPTAIDTSKTGNPVIFVTQQDGLIYRYEIAREYDSQAGELTQNYSVTDTVEIDFFLDVIDYDDDGDVATNFTATTKRQITGLLTTTDEDGNDVLYVTSSDPRIAVGVDSGLDTNSSQIHKLTLDPVTGEILDSVALVRGLPRSEENHSVNGLDIGIDPVTGHTMLYVAVGGNTNTGAPGNNFSGTVDFALSGAILKFDLTELESYDVRTDGNGEQFILDLPTLDDPTRSNIDLSTLNIQNLSLDPNFTLDDNGTAPDWAGGNNGLNQAKITDYVLVSEGGQLKLVDNPMTVYSPGDRNAYDVLVTQDGEIFTWDNGPNGGWGGQPISYSDGQLVDDWTSELATNQFSELGSDGYGDQLHYLGELGDEYGPYQGHPNVFRAAAEALAAAFNSDGTYKGATANDPIVVGTETIFLNEADALNFLSQLLIIYEEQGDGNWVDVTGTTGLPADLFDLVSGYDWYHPGSSISDPTTYYDGSSVMDGTVYSPESQLIDHDNDGSLVTTGSSTNGLAEYTATFFGGALNGAIIAASFDGNLYFELPLDTNGDGRTDAVESLGTINGFGSSPLDLTTLGDDGFSSDVLIDLDGDGVDDFAGLIIAATYGADNITIFTPGGQPLAPNTDLDLDGLNNTVDSHIGDPLEGKGVIVSGSETELWHFELNDPSTTPSGAVPSGDSIAGDIGLNAVWRNNTTVQYDQDGGPALYTPGIWNLGGASTIVSIDVADTGSAVGTANDQGDVLGIGFAVDATTSAVTIQTEMVNIFTYSLNTGANKTWDGGEKVGLVVGPGDQTNYAEAAIAVIDDNGTIKYGIQLLVEANDVPQTVFVEMPGVEAPTILGVGDPNFQVEIVLDLTVGEETAIARGRYVDNGVYTDWFETAALSLPQEVIDAVKGNYDNLGKDTGAFVGLLSSAPSGDDSFGASWDYVTVTGTSSGSEILYRWNAGPSDVAAIDDGPDWVTDSATIIGATGFSNQFGAANGLDASVPAATTPTSLYDNELYGSNAGNEMGLEFGGGTLEDGTYIVRLYMGNGYDGTSQPGERVFDVLIEGALFLDDVDLVAEFGHKVGGVFEWVGTVTDGTIDIDFLHGSADNPLINAVEIISLTAQTTAPQISVLDATVGEGDGSVTVTVQSDVTLTEDVNVTYEIRPILNGATPEVDYTVVGATYIAETGIYSASGTIVANSSDLTFQVSIIDDSEVETDELFEVVITNVAGANAEISDGTASITITDNEPIDSFNGTPVTGSDFSEDRLNPTDVTLDLGSNTLVAAQNPSDLDYVTFVVQEGQELTAINLTNYVGGGNFTFLGIQTGDTFPDESILLSGGSDLSALLDGGTLYNDTSVGTNILDELTSTVVEVDGRTVAGLPTPLAAGTYTLWFSQNGNPTQTELEFVTEAVSNPGGVVTAINVGGSALSQDGIDFSADAAFVNGTVFVDGPTDGNGEQPAFDGTVYESERFAADLQFAIPVATGESYTIDLYFAEIYQSSAGARVFDVFVEGQLVLDDFDILAQNGGDINVPVVLTLDGTFSPETFGAADTLDLQFVSSVDNAKVSGIVVRSATPPNTPPFAQPDAVTTDEDTVLNGDVLADNGNGPDSDDDGDTLTVIEVEGQTANVGQQITLASGALLTLNSDGTFAYDPNGQFEDLNAGETDTDSFTYKISDGNGGESTATVDVTIDGVTDPGAVLVAINAGGPALQQDGIDFAADTAFLNGTPFTDSPTDGNGEQPVFDGTVFETERYGTDLQYAIPVATGESYTIELYFAETYQNFAGERVFDLYVENQLILDDFDILAQNGGDINVPIVLTLDGTFSPETFGAADTLDLQFVSSVDNAKVSGIVVRSASPNTPPVAQDDAVSTDEDTALLGDVFADNGNGPDADDDGDTLTVIEVEGQTANVGQQITLASGALLTLNSDGTFAYDPNGQFEGLNDGDTDSDSFTYKISDGNGGESTATVSVTIDGVTDVVNTPPVAQDDDVSTDEDTNLTFNVLTDNGNGADSDDDGDTLTVTQLDGSAGNVGNTIGTANGSLIFITPEGEFTFTPSAQYQDLENGETATETFTYTISDGNGGESTATITVTIDGVTDNIPPIAQDDDVTTDEDTTLNGDVLADNGNGPDSDDDGDTLTVIEVEGQTASVGQPIALASGALLVLNSDGTFAYNPNGQFESLNDGDTGSDSFTYKISDGNGGESTATVNISIDGITDIVPNVPPVAQDDAVSTDEDTPLSGDVLADNGNGPDSDDDGDTLTVIEVEGQTANVGQQITLTSGALLTLNSDGTFDYDPNGQFESLNSGDTGADSFTYKISDGNGGESTATVDVTIDGVDEPVGAATFSITKNATNVQSSNFGGGSFQITNTGDKVITSITIDVTDALLTDAVFDPFGLAGDQTAKQLTIDIDGNTGVDAPSAASYIGTGGTSGYEGLLLTFDQGTNGGFEPGETIAFSVDMDPNSISGADKTTLDSGANPPWDIGGVSGAELIGSTYTITFADGTTATGQLQSNGNQAGAIGIATQDSAGDEVTLTVNSLAEGGVGTYTDGGPSVIINGPAGETARIVLMKGIIQPTDNNFSEPYASQLQAQLDALAASDYPANNAAEFQIVDVVLTGGDQDISSLFNFTEVPFYDLAVDESQVPLAFAASVIDPSNQNLPTGPVTDAIYLTYVEPPALVLTADPTSISEMEGVSTITVTRAGDLTNALIVTLVTDDTSEISVPTTVEIPAGAASATFFATGVDDAILDGTQTPTITASAAGYTDGEVTIDVTDDESAPQLQVGLFDANTDQLITLLVDGQVVDPSLIAGKSLTIAAIVPESSIYYGQVESAAIDLNNGAFTKLESVEPYALFGDNNAGADYAGKPNILVLGQNSVEFDLFAGNGGGGGLVDTVVLNFTVGSEPLETLSLSLDPTSVSEAGGVATATVTRTGDTTDALTVTLQSSDTTEATVPTTVIIPAGQASATFQVTAIDDALFDGTQTATITASATDFTNATANLDVTDDEVVETLSLSLDPTSVSEAGGTATATLTRTGDTTDALTVTLQSSDTTEATVPTTVIIPAGQASVTFQVTAVDDVILDGTQSALITASATGFTDGTATLDVTDDEVPAEYDIEIALYNAQTDELITLLSDGQVISVSQIPNAPLTIVAFVPENSIYFGQVESMTMDFNSGQAVRVESVEPYALFADSNGDYYGKSNLLQSGLNSIVLGLYSGNGAGGSLLETVSVNFSVGEVTEDPVLSLSIDPTSISENGGTATGTVTRTGDTSAALTVTLASDDTSEATVPTTVIIAAGQASATFQVTAVDDAIVDGTQTPLITASATGFADTSATLDVTDDDVVVTPTLSVDIAPGSISENGGTATGTVTRTGDTSSALTVTLASDDTSEATVPTTVIIAAGQASATFQVTAVDDAIVDGTQTPLITASATGFADASATLDVTDDDVAVTPILSLDISPSSMSENGGTATGTVTRTGDTSSALTVTLGSDDTSEATVPTTVIIAAGQASATFQVSAVDDAIVDGTQTPLITASATGFDDATATIDVTDNEFTPGTLSVSVDPGTISENGGSAIGTVTRTGDTSGAIAVDLTSSDTTEVIVTQNIVIPAGQASATFQVFAVNDTIVDGTQTPIITASSSGYNNATTTINVTDNDVPATPQTITVDVSSDGEQVGTGIFDSVQIGSDNDLEIGGGKTSGLLFTDVSLSVDPATIESAQLILSSQRDQTYAGTVDISLSNRTDVSSPLSGANLVTDSTFVFHSDNVDPSGDSQFSDGEIFTLDVTDLVQSYYSQSGLNDMADNDLLFALSTESGVLRFDAEEFGHGATLEITFIDGSVIGDDPFA